MLSSIPKNTKIPFLYDVAASRIAGKVPFNLIGYHPTIDTTEEDVWGYGGTQGTYVFPTAEMAMEVVSSDNTQDIGTVIKGDATGNTVQADADGTTTTIEDDSVDFTAGTAVAAGDIVILDPHGTTPEWGYVTAVATNTLTIGNGFSEGGTGASRYYAVVDKSAYTGGLVIHFHYLDDAYAAHEEIVVLNGTTVVATINTDIFRVQSSNIIGTGSSNAPVGNIFIRNTADTPVYSYISAEYTRSRDMISTIPAGYTGYMKQWHVGWATPDDIKVQTARFRGLANAEPLHQFQTGDIFYPYSEIIVSNSQVEINFDIPLKMPEKTDMRVVGKAFTGGVGPCAMVARGWMEAN